LLSALQTDGADVYLFEWTTKEETPDQETLQELHERPITLFTVTPTDLVAETMPKTMRAGVVMAISNPTRLVLGVPEALDSNQHWNDPFMLAAPLRAPWPDASTDVIERVLALTAMRPQHSRFRAAAEILQIRFVQALLSRGYYEEAIAWLQPLLRESTAPRGTRALLAYTYARMNMWAECVAMGRAAIENIEGRTISFYCWGLGLNGLERYDEALGPFGRALSTHPALSGAWVGQGKALLHLGRRHEAVDSLKRGLASATERTQNAWAYEDADVSIEATSLLSEAQDNPGRLDSESEDGKQ
jgi:tetratricopeptide (TPR) repeat protein